jgi:hypothetical protein
MKNTFKKGMILGIVALFISVSSAPLFSAEPQLQEARTTPIEITSIQQDGSYATETFQLTTDEMTSVIRKIQEINDALNKATDRYSLIDILLGLLRGNNNNPLLSKIIQNILGNGINIDKKFIASAGWGLNLNPMKDMKTDFVKPLTFWHYAEMSDAMQVQSMTALFQFNPIKFKTAIGSQIGFMFRFKGIYVHMPEQYPNQSFTFFAGTAKQIVNIELNINMPQLP